MNAQIHPSALVEVGAVLGAGVLVGPFAWIQAGARVGEGCRIGPHAVIYRGTTLGRDCRVHAGAVLGDAPQDLDFKEAESFVVIGDRCTIREGVTIHRGAKPGTTTVIGNDCFLMGFSHYAHNVKLGNQVIAANGVLLAGYVDVGDRAFISGHVGVHQFVRIGRLAMLGGNGGISSDVPPFCTTHSVRLNEIAGLNTVGLRRAGMSPEERADLKKAFRLVYRSGLNTSQALERLRAECRQGPAREFGEFIAASTRGICGGPAAAPAGE